MRSFADEIRQTISDCMRADESIVLMGLGVNDPKGVFGTTLNLYKEFGENRIIETPTSENAMLGVAVGLSLAGFKVIHVHQRLDFFLLAMDQLVNSAAKWNYMFGDKTPINVTIRLILGRGWGQGPTHSQNLHAIFTHIPGVRVYMPSFARDIRSMLEEAIDFPGPAIFLEDRWLHLQKHEIVPINQISKVPSKVKHSLALSTGNDVTVISSGFLLIECLRAANSLQKSKLGVNVIDLKVLKPLDFELLVSYCRKSRLVFVVDSGPEFGNYGKEIAYQLNLYLKNLEQPVMVLSERDNHEPTSHGVIREFKLNSQKIAQFIFKNVFSTSAIPNFSELISDFPDIPDKSFQGPF
jgi:acetoin:2,6-dichlorophenolindophenol oxidoreductase subunit beta